MFFVFLFGKKNAERVCKYFQVLKNVTFSYYKIKNFFTLYNKN